MYDYMVSKKGQIKKPWEVYCLSNTLIVQLAGTVEYTDNINAEGKDLPNECLGYDSKQSDGEVPVMLEFWGLHSQVHFDPEW